MQNTNSMFEISFENINGIVKHFVYWAYPDMRKHECVNDYKCLHINDKVKLKDTSYTWCPT